MEINEMKRLSLEYRVRKLEKLLLEDSFDDELDAMSDKILKNNPYVDIDDEVDKKAKDIIDKEPGYFYHADKFGDYPKTYDTIQEWLDDKVVDIQLNPNRPHNGNVVKDLNLAIKQLTHIVDGLNYVRRLKKYIKEISDMNVLVAQQKLVNALRKRIKEEGPKQIELLNKHKEQFRQFVEDLKAYLESEIRKRVSGGKSYYITSAILQNNDFSVDFVVRDNYYKDRSILFNVTECKHIAWNIKHLYDIKMKKVWPSEKQNMKDKRLNENEVKKFLSSKLCWKLNGYEFDEGKFYPYDPNF